MFAPGSDLGVAAPPQQQSRAMSLLPLSPNDEEARRVRVTAFVKSRGVDDEHQWNEIVDDSIMEADAAWPKYENETKTLEDLIRLTICIAQRKRCRMWRLGKNRSQPLPPGLSVPEPRGQDGEWEERIRRCFAKLPAREQDVLRRRFWGDQAMSAIAEELETSPASAYRWYKCGLSALRVCINRQLD